MPEFSGKKDFLSALDHWIVHGKITNPLVLLGSSWARIRKII
jgi:hypothetical protein